MFFQSKDINVRFALWPYMGCAHTQLHTVGFRLNAVFQASSVTGWFR
jgi:hypothetical protein